MKRDKDALLEHYVGMVPEALDALTPEERHALYQMLRLRVVADPEGCIEVQGVLSENLGVCRMETSSSPRFTRTTPPAPYHVSPTWV